LGGDHAGFEYKTKLIEILKNKGYTIKDFGPVTNASCDYPDYVHPLAQAIEKGEYEQGIIICGSANGVNITANKYQGVRSALCWLPEIAQLARGHNDANVLALPARFIDFDTAVEISDAFLTTDFEGGRHQARVDKIAVK
jgi:ribose 5-phosphate isomerase B